MVQYANVTLLIANYYALRERLLFWDCPSLFFLLFIGPWLSQTVQHPLSDVYQRLGPKL